MEMLPLFARTYETGSWNNSCRRRNRQCDKQKGTPMNQKVDTTSEVCSACKKEATHQYRVHMANASATLVRYEQDRHDMAFVCVELWKISPPWVRNAIKRGQSLINDAWLYRSYKKGKDPDWSVEPQQPQSPVEKKLRAELTKTRTELKNVSELVNKMQGLIKELLPCNERQSEVSHFVENHINEVVDRDSALRTRLFDEMLTEARAAVASNE